MGAKASGLLDVGFKEGMILSTFPRAKDSRTVAAKIHNILTKDRSSTERDRIKNLNRQTHISIATVHFDSFE